MMRGRLKEENMSTLLVIAPGSNTNCDTVFHLLVAETGEHLASHLCSNASFAYSDLYARRTERIEQWTKRFGEFEVKFIDETSLTEHELIARNQNWYNEKYPEPPALDE